ncbi:MAG TPA: hypothetical protein VGL89_08415 [Candidatus Koribacter sp.]
MLLILMFFVALVAFSMMAVLPRVIQEVKRDREEEMIHRGTEYARAIKKYYKKFNRYPNSLQDLENTNNIRFLRRRYKDPLAKDGNWRLLHITDVQQGVSNPNFGLSQSNNFNPTPGGPGAQGEAGAGGFGTQINIGGSSNGGAGTPTGGGSQNSGGTDNSGGGASFNPNGGTSGQITTTGDTSGSPGGTGATSTSNPGNTPTGAQPGQTYGAGGIVGVESLNKAKTIREFGSKHNYNKWMFIYDPTQDRGTLLKGPYNPQAFQGGGTNGQPGQNGQPGGVSLPGSGQQNPGGPGQQMPPDQNAPPQ